MRFIFALLLFLSVTFAQVNDKNFKEKINGGVVVAVFTSEWQEQELDEKVLKGVSGYQDCKVLWVKSEQAKKVVKNGLEAEIIDLRTLLPFDAETCIKSVNRTSRLLILQESQWTGGLGHTISSRIMEEAFWNLESPPVVIGALDTPVPFSPPLEDYTIPTSDLVVRHIERLCSQ